MAAITLEDAPIQVTVPHAEHFDDHVVYKLVVRQGEASMQTHLCSRRNDCHTRLRCCMQARLLGLSCAATANLAHYIIRSRLYWLGSLDLAHLETWYEAPSCEPEASIEE